MPDGATVENWPIQVENVVQGDTDLVEFDWSEYFAPVSFDGLMREGNPSFELKYTFIFIKSKPLSYTMSTVWWLKLKKWVKSDGMEHGEVQNSQ